MKKFLKLGVCFCLCALFVFAVGCKKSRSSENPSKAMIGENNYQTLGEAVEEAKSGDTIKIFDDLLDHKNVVIDKPIKIKGILSSNQIRPKFYGSLTIDLGGEEEETNIEDIEIIHDGQEADGKNNNTLVGINLLDGGLTLKNSKVMLAPSKENTDLASGLIISRRLSSQNHMPILIEGNTFGEYKTNSSDLSGAVIIKRKGVFKDLSLDVDKIYGDNTFVSKENGNLIVSLNLDSTIPNFSYLATSSSDQLAKALLERQDSKSKFILIPTSPLTIKLEQPLAISKNTSVVVDGNSEASFEGVKIVVYGSFVDPDGKLKSAKIERGNNEANVIYKQG